MLFMMSAGVFAFVYPQRLPVTAGAAIREISVPDALENSLAHTRQKNTAEKLQSAIKQFTGKSGRVSNRENEVTFKPAQITVNDSSRVTYIFDNAGNIAIKLGEKFSDGSWKNNSQTVYTYNEQGKTTSSSYQYWTNGNWQVRLFTEINYNESGMIAEQTVSEMKETGLQQTARHLFTYTTNGSIATYSSQERSSGAWVNSERSSYTYNGMGSQTGMLYESWTNNSWQPEYRETYTYNGVGAQTGELIENYVESRWVPYSRSTLTYNQFQFAELVLVEKFNGSYWVNDNQIVYSYDFQNFTIAQLSQLWQNNQWINKQRYTIGLTQDGDIASALDEEWIGNDWGNKTLRTFTFSGNKLESELVQKFNQSWENAEKRTYQYDEFGNALVGKSYAWINNNWVEGAGPLTMTYNNGEDEILQFGRIVYIQYTSTTGIGHQPLMDRSFLLEQNYPNPFIILSRSFFVTGWYYQPATCRYTHRWPDFRR